MMACWKKDGTCRSGRYERNTSLGDTHWVLVLVTKRLIESAVQTKKRFQQHTVAVGSDFADADEVSDREGTPNLAARSHGHP